MGLELRGRTAVVTGGSVGIGREIARVLAAEGLPTLVIARSSMPFLLMLLVLLIRPAGLFGDRQ